MDDHFDICRVFEVSKFDIARLTCNKKGYFAVKFALWHTLFIFFCKITKKYALLKKMIKPINNKFWLSLTAVILSKLQL